MSVDSSVTSPSYSALAYPHQAPKAPATPAISDFEDADVVKAAVSHVAKTGTVAGWKYDPQGRRVASAGV